MKSLVRLSSFAFALAWLGAAPAMAQMRVERFDTLPTANEINSFKAYIVTVNPGTGGNLSPKNDWVQHQSGQRTKAMGLMYEMTGDLDILDRMIHFCDAIPGQRNDVAPAPLGQHVVWTGRIDPVWHNATVPPIGTGGEQGDPPGHLGYCARLILETPAIWDMPVRIGDPKGYGATYLARAQRFVAEAEVAMDGHILSSLLDLNRDRKRLYWSAGNPYQGGAVPWNQTVMFTYAFQNLAACHLILGDDPAKAVLYDEIVKANVDWFFSGDPGSARPYINARGNTAYLWAYKPPSGTEDWSHGNLDVQGLYRAYESGKYGITFEQMVPLANTMIDVIRRGFNDFAGRVNGTDGTGNSAPTTHVRPGWYVTVLFRPSAYCDIMSDDLTIGGTTTDITRFSYFLWVKHKRFAAGTPAACVPLPTPTPTPTPTPLPGLLGPNLAKGKPSTASTNWSSSFNSPKAFDGTDSTRWSASAASATNQWIAVDLVESQPYNCVVLKEINFIRVTSHILQGSDDGVTYFDIPDTLGAGIGPLKTTCFETVTSRYVRLFMYEARQSGSLKEPTINEVQVYFQDRPPVLEVPEDIVAEATGPDGAAVTFTASADDEKDGLVAVTMTPPSGSTFPLGTTTVAATARDSAGLTATATFDVTVRDTTPPVIERLAASPRVIWPPNHQMVTVNVAVQVAEAVDAAPAIRILAVSSNEPENGTGDGDTSPDWAITGDLTLEVRAERAGGGTGRIYTVTVESRDASGNASTRTVGVTIAHDQGQ